MLVNLSDNFISFYDYFWKSDITKDLLLLSN